MKGDPETMRKELVITSADIQRAIIALIYAETTKPAALPASWSLAAEETLNDLNNLCSAQNGYKLKVTIDA